MLRHGDADLENKVGGSATCDGLDLAVELGAGEAKGVGEGVVVNPALAAAYGGADGIGHLFYKGFVAFALHRACRSRDWKAARCRWPCARLRNKGLRTRRLRKRHRLKAEGAMTQVLLSY